MIRARRSARDNSPANLSKACPPWRARAGLRGVVFRLLLPALAGLLLTAGCSCPCGYADMRSTLSPLPGERRVETTSLARPLQVTRPISDRNPVLEAAFSALETTEGPARLDTYGKATYVACKWYSPLVKFGAIISIVCPWYLPAHEPHAHGAGNWSRADYFRDVLAWYNLCSGVPTGPQEMDARERLIRSMDMVAPLSQRLVPVPGRGVTLSLDGKQLARSVTAADGTVRFDLAPFLKPEMAKQDHTVQLTAPVEAGAEVELTIPLEGKIVNQLLSGQPAQEKK